MGIKQLWQVLSSFCSSSFNHHLVLSPSRSHVLYLLTLPCRCWARRMFTSTASAVACWQASNPLSRPLPPHPALIIDQRTLTIAEGFEGAREDRLYRIGVDVSIWVQQLQQVFVKAHAQAGENPELRMFFYRLAMLAERPVHLVFVADGPSRPAIKRKTRVKTAPHWMLDGMQRLVEAFGYDWLQAAGEAEAELARMNQLGIIDAVLTEDSDALLFGAPVVIRNPSYKRNDSDVVTIYRADDIRQAAGLSSGDLLLLALLLGSDYDPIGLPRCGPKVAYGLAKYGLGRSLYAAIQTMPDEELTAYLSTWRSLLRDRLRQDPHGHIGRIERNASDLVGAWTVCEISWGREQGEDVDVILWRDLRGRGLSQSYRAPRR
ncbi:hypothetical protein NUW54_g8841 [Trametes sanguinea]|uniref:Uncharacterized protein n=1 Tax=Trametes sanguinea TaxID=158606 RepID=A0ACC1PBQ9_9APHY|nr:hypothetical protein NUW54_g8841 [Trametes sanguinea]